MKQLVVLVSTVLLGIAIGTLILDFSHQADSISESVGTSIESMIGEFEGAGGVLP